MNFHGKVDRKRLHEISLGSSLEGSEEVSVFSIEEILASEISKKTGQTIGSFEEIFAAQLGISSLDAVELSENILQRILQHFPQLKSFEQFDAISAKFRQELSVEILSRSIPSIGKWLKIQLQNFQEIPLTKRQKIHRMENSSEIEWQRRFEESLVEIKSWTTNFHPNEKKLAKKLNSTTAMRWKLLWEENLGECVDSNPLIVEFQCNDETVTVVFLGSHVGKFFALELNSGRILWEVPMHDRVTG
jgi:hypothetical protein